MLINLERARGLMKDYGIDVLIATTPENVLYCSDYAPWQAWIYRGNTPAKGTQMYAIIPRDSGTAPALIPAGITYNTFAYLAQFPSWIEDYYPYAPPTSWPYEIPDVPDFTDPGMPPEAFRLRELTDRFKPRATKTSGEALVKALRDRGLERGVVALEGFGLSPAARERLQRELPNLKLKEAGEFLRYIRAVKTAQEIEYIRRAAEINEKAFQKMLAKVAPGVTTEELVIEQRTACAREGAMPSFMNVSAAGHPGLMWEPTIYALRPGDVIWADGGCSYHHYHADTGLSCVVGEPTQRMIDNFAAVQDCMEAARTSCRPGVSCSGIQSAMHAAMHQHGWSNPMAYGHGIGIEERDYPILTGPYHDFNDEILSGSNDLIMETNMVVCLEVNIWEWGTGGIKAEQTVVVTPTGCEVICQQDRILFSR